MKNFIASSRKGSIKADVLFDDGGHNMKDWFEEGHEHGILIDTTYNKDADHRCVRVRDWSEAIQAIDVLAQFDVN
jgi:5'(3')-deoxyribonucleotidase